MTLCALVLLALLTAVPLARSQSTYVYNGDATPSSGAYAGWFTTVGPGHPTGSYFVGTTWSSNGSYLTMTTEHPNDYVGATSKGIWFGLGYGYGDDPGIGFTWNALGNDVTTRLALAPSSSQWSLYWFDANGYEAAIYFENTGFTYYTAAGATFVSVADMTAFHTYGTHLYQGQVTYTLDGSMIAHSAAIGGGPGGLMIFGDGSATDVSGYGSLLIDSLTLTVGTAAPIAIPEPAEAAFGFGALALAGLALQRRRVSLVTTNLQ
jgi:hypothetical protein